MTGMPNASSNRLSADGGSGAEAERTKRTRPAPLGRGRVHGQHGDDRGNRVDPGDPPLCDQRPESPAAELAVQHQAGPGGQGGEQPDHLGVDVEQREAAVAPVGRGQPVVAGHGGGDVGQLILAQQDALGCPGGPARAQEDPSGPGPPGRAGRAGRGSVSAHAPGPFGPNDLSGGLSTARPGGRPEPESPTAACGRATASTRESSAAGAAGSSGITTRPAARMLTRTVA